MIQSDKRKTVMYRESSSHELNEVMQTKMSGL